MSAAATDAALPQPVYRLRVAWCVAIDFAEKDWVGEKRQSDDLGVITDNHIILPDSTSESSPTLSDLHAE